MMLRALIFLSLVLCTTAPVASAASMDADALETRTTAPADSTAMAFESLSASFGTMTDDAGEQLLQYRFVNRSGKSLAITALMPTCPCIKASSDKSVYPDGEEGTISVAFNPWRMAGNIDLRVLVYTGLRQDMPTAVLRIEGEVVSADPWDYLPVKAGSLRLKSGTAVFAHGEKVVRILCANTSDKALKPAAELVPKGVAAWFEPEVIPPQAEADLVIRMEAPVRGGFTVKAGERDITMIKLKYEDE